MGFSRKEYWSELPFPTPGDLPNPGIEPVSRVTPALTGGFYATEPPGKPRLFPLDSTFPPSPLCDCFIHYVCVCPDQCSFLGSLHTIEFTLLALKFSRFLNAPLQYNTEQSYYSVSPFSHPSFLFSPSGQSLIILLLLYAWLLSRFSPVLFF